MVYCTTVDFHIFKLKFWSKNTAFKNIAYTLKRFFYISSNYLGKCLQYFIVYFLILVFTIVIEYCWSRRVVVKQGASSEGILYC